jgi:hypothetical protein
MDLFLRLLTCIEWIELKRAVDKVSVFIMYNMDRD